MLTEDTAYAHQALKQQISKRISLTDAEFEVLAQSFKPVKVKKRQFLVQPDFVAHWRYYVVKGAFRAYVIDEQGNEHTIQFAIDDWWITDYNSYIFQQPASMFVMALEDSLILQIEHKAEHILKKQNHHYETFFRFLAEHTAAYMARRVIIGLTQTAEERYTNFLSQYPQVVQRVPQYALASFLGMTTEYLSKLRNKRPSTKS